MDKLFFDPVHLALTHAQHGRDVAGPGPLGAAARLVAVEQNQGIDDFGRGVRAFACNFLQFGSFWFGQGDFVMFHPPLSTSHSS